MNTESLINRNEIRRLEKAARDGNKQHLGDWLRQFVDRADALYRKEYDKIYQEEINSTIENFMLALAYTLHFSEEFHLGKDRLPEFINDLLVTVDLFRTGEYKPSDYEEELAKHGVYLDEKFDYQKVYRERLEALDKLIDEYKNKVDKLDKNTSETYQNQK